MRATEFILETKVGTLHINGLVIDVDDHSFERTAGRRVNTAMVDRVVRRLINIQDQILNIEAGQKFWVYSQSFDIGLGLSKQSESNRILLKTVVGDRPWDSDIPVLEL